MKLKIGKIYMLQKQTALVPVFEPKDGVEAMEAIKKIVQILPGGIIKIISISYKRDIPWYQVAIQDRGEVVTGWVNSIALFGQEIKELVDMKVDKNYFIGALTRHERFVSALRTKVAGMKPEDLVPAKFTGAERLIIFQTLNESCFTDESNNLLDVDKIIKMAEESDKWTEQQGGVE